MSPEGFKSNLPWISHNVTKAPVVIKRGIMLKTLGHSEDYMEAAYSPGDTSAFESAIQ